MSGLSGGDGLHSIGEVKYVRSTTGMGEVLSERGKGSDSTKFNVSMDGSRKVDAPWPDSCWRTLKPLLTSFCTEYNIHRRYLDERKVSYYYCDLNTYPVNTAPLLFDNTITKLGSSFCNRDEWWFTICWYWCFWWGWWRRPKWRWRWEVMRGQYLSTHCTPFARYFSRAGRGGLQATEVSFFLFLQRCCLKSVFVLMKISNNKWFSIICGINFAIFITVWEDFECNTIMIT